MWLQFHALLCSGVCSGLFMSATRVPWYVPHGNTGLSKHGVFPHFCPLHQNLARVRTGGLGVCAHGLAPTMPLPCAVWQPPPTLKAIFGPPNFNLSFASRRGGSDLTQHAKGRTGDCPGPREETRRTTCPQKHREAGGGRPECAGEWAAKAEKRTPQQTAQPPLGSANAETTPAGTQAAATRRNMRREERIIVQGPVKKQQPDGMSHRGINHPL